MENRACYIKNKMKYNDYWHGLGLTSTIIVQEAFDLPKPQEVAPISVFPTSQDHPNVKCHMMLPHKDLRKRSSIKSAKIFSRNKIKIYQNDLLLCHAIHSSGEFSLCYSLRSPGKRVQRRSTWSQMSGCRRTLSPGEVRICVPGIWDKDGLHLRLDKHKSMKILHHPVMQ